MTGIGRTVSGVFLSLFQDGLRNTLHALHNSYRSVHFHRASVPMRLYEVHFRNSVSLRMVARIVRQDRRVNIPNLV